MPLEIPPTPEITEDTKLEEELGLPWKVIVLNIAFLLMGIGLGVFIASILDTYSGLGDAVYPATIFFMAGVGLFIGFNLTKKLDEE